MAEERRQRVLTDADLEAFAAIVNANRHDCQFSAEEVQFVRSWLDTMKTVKSETIKYLVKGLFLFLGVVAAISVYFKLLKGASNDIIR